MSEKKEGVKHIKLNLISKVRTNLQNRGVGFSSSKDRSSCTMSKQSKEMKEQNELYESSSNDCQSMEQPLEYSPIEKVGVSQFTFNKLVLLEKQLFFTLIVQLYCGFMLVEIENVQGKDFEEDLFLGLMTVTSLWLIALTIARKLVTIKLEIDQKFMYHYVAKHPSIIAPTLRALLSNKNHFLGLTLQLLLILLHPNPFTKTIFFTIYDQSYNLNLSYSLNDLLGVLMLLKYFIMIRSAINLTKFTTPRVKRVCSMNQIQYSQMYSIKCIQKMYPIRLVIILVFFLIVLFGYGFRVSEGTVSSYNSIGKNGFEELINCFWFAFITLYNVGYGQFVPKTIVSRFLAAILSVVGMASSSMMLVSVFDYLMMSSQQNKALNLTHRLINRKTMQKDGANIIATTINLNQLLKGHSSSKNNKTLLKNSYQTIKLSIDEIKAHRLLIKNIKPQNDITEIMIQDFTRTRQNFSQICQSQVKLQLILENTPHGKYNLSKELGQHFKQFINKSLSISRSNTLQEL